MKAIWWLGLGSIARRQPKLATALITLGALYVIQFFDLTPAGVANQTAELVIVLAMDALGLNDWWASRNHTHLLWRFFGLVGLCFLMKTAYLNWWPLDRRESNFAPKRPHESEDSSTTYLATSGSSDRSSKAPDLNMEDLSSYKSSNRAESGTQLGNKPVIIEETAFRPLEKTLVFPTEVLGRNGCAKEVQMQWNDLVEEVKYDSRLDHLDQMKTHGLPNCHLMPRNPDERGLLTNNQGAKQSQLQQEVGEFLLQDLWVGKDINRNEKLEEEMRKVDYLAQGITQANPMDNRKWVGGNGEYPARKYSDPIEILPSEEEKIRSPEGFQEPKDVEENIDTSGQGDGKDKTDINPPEGDSAKIKETEDTQKVDVPEETDLAASKGGDGDGEGDPIECQAGQILLCDSGKPFGGKHCSKKVKEMTALLIEDRLLLDTGMIPSPPFNEPLTVHLCALHLKKYGDRVKELVCTLPTCYGRGFACVYGETVFRYCHLHMATALENEVKTRFQVHDPQSVSVQNEWEDESLWRDAQSLTRGNGFPRDGQRVDTERARSSDEILRTLPEFQKRRLSEGHEASETTKKLVMAGESFYGPRENGGNETGGTQSKEPETKPVRRHSVGGPDSVLGRFAQPGTEEDVTRSADLEGMMPSFVRRPREKPTYIPVEMQIDYESGTKAKEPWEVVAEGIGELRQGNEDKEAKGSAKLTEFLVFALRGFGCFRTELGIGAYGKDLCDTLKRQATVMKEYMYRKGIRVPLTNRIVVGLAEAAWGSEVPNGAPEGSLLARDFVPWDLSSFEDHVRKDDKVEGRGRPPTAMNIISRAIKQQIKIFGAVYGEEHVEERLEALSFLEDLHESYEEFFSPTFLMAVWDEMTFEYTMVVTEGIRRMLQALPKGARRDKLKERALTPRIDGSTTWKFPITFKMTNSLGFWKSRIVPRLERKVERERDVTICNPTTSRETGSGRNRRGICRRNVTDYCKQLPINVPGGKKTNVSRTKRFTTVFAANQWTYAVLGLLCVGWMPAWQGLH